MLFAYDEWVFFAMVWYSLPGQIRGSGGSMPARQLRASE
jgi:hypothetical protein